MRSGVSQGLAARIRHAIPLKALTTGLEDQLQLWRTVSACQSHIIVF